VDERLKSGLCFRVVRDPVHQHADTQHPFGTVRAPTAAARSPRRTKDAKTVSKSRSVLARMTWSCSPGVRAVVCASVDGAAIFASACKMGLEGTVSKRRDSRYQSGRSRDWIKVKNPQSPAMLRLQDE
jgi:hypothetical protein